MTKFRHLTLEELLFRAEEAANYSPLIEELVKRLRHPDDGEEVFRLDQITTTQCPVCEAILDISTFADESTPNIRKAVL